VVKDDFTTVIVKKAIDSIIKYAFRPDLVKNRRRNFSEAAKKRVIQRQANLCNICGDQLDIKEFLDLRHKMWKGKLWNPSYYVGTAGHVSAQTIERYIREQEKH